MLRQIHRNWKVYLMEYSVRQSKRNRKKRINRLLVLFLFALIGCIIWIVAELFVPIMILKNAVVPDWVDVQIIDIDGASRRGERLEGLKDIVIHYVGNPGTTAQQNRNYYNNSDSEVSAHFNVGLDGEVIQCVPLDEKSSASNWRNDNTISIEVCHPDETGQFTEATYDSLVQLTAWLCDLRHLNIDHIIRHYDISGKECPRYYVQHEDKWERFKADVAQYRKFD